MKSRIPTSDLLNGLLRAGPGEQVTVERLVTRLGHRSFGLILLLLGLLATLPGVSVVAGVLIGILAVQMIIGRQGLAFPRRVGARPVARRRLARIVGWATPTLKLVERIARPRWATPFRATKRGVGIFVLAIDALLFAPIPFSNVPPAIAIALIAAAYLEEDGLLLSCALAAGTLLIALMAGAAWQVMSGLGWVQGI